MDDLLDELYNVRQTKNNLNQQEKYLKWKIHTLMNQQGVNQFVTDNYRTFRYIQSREMIKRSKIDQGLWNQLATEEEYPVLKVVPN